VKGLGATGRFPRGKLRADDEGELAAQFVIQDGTLLLIFGREVSWIGFGVADVEALIATLQRKLIEMKGAGP
jgi:hypothetical protein